MLSDNVSTLDLGVRACALEVLKEVFGILITGISPAGRPCRRAEIAIREITFMLHEQAELFELDANLRAALFDIGNGSEPTLPDDVRSLWDNRHRIPFIHSPPEEAQ
jgi:hypothetical protein